MTLVQIVQCLGMYRTATPTAHTPLIIPSVYKYMFGIYVYKYKYSTDYTLCL